MGARLLSQYRLHHPNGRYESNRNHQTSEQPKRIRAQALDGNVPNLVEWHPLEVIRVGFGNEFYPWDVDGSVTHGKMEWLGLSREVQLDCCLHLFSFFRDNFVSHLLGDPTHAPNDRNSAHAGPRDVNCEAELNAHPGRWLQRFLDGIVLTFFASL